MKHFYRINENCNAKILEEMPNGWRVLKGTLTQPCGTVWIATKNPMFTHDEKGKPVINPEYKSCLFFEDKKFFLEYHANDERYTTKK